jgi:cardiolipin synthase A/B
MYFKTAIKQTGRRMGSGSGYISHNTIQLVRGGKPYFDQILHMINHAKVIIQLQVYIYDDDETGKEITRALVGAAKRKVQVYLMVDGYASQKLSRKFMHELKEAGVHFRFFEPLFRSRHSYFGRRLHHKVIVVDNLYGMVGGINISNHYNDMPNQPGWLDFAVYMEGAVAKELCRICQKTWKGYLTEGHENFCSEKPDPLYISPDNDCKLRVRRNDWILKKNQVSRSYLEMFRRAEREIIMMSGYFLPGPIIRRNMKLAVKKGVKIKLILAGISDVSVAKNAERFMYNWLFKNNISVYEYKPCVLHGKVAVHDRSWATVGSYNVNIISAYASIELNIDINNSTFAAGLQDLLEQIIRNDCELITPENFIQHRGILPRIWDRICYGFIRFLFYIFTFNFKQRDN